MFTIAVARKPGENFSQGITSSNLGLPDYSLMLKQHNAYVETLQRLGLDIVLLDPLLEFPDAYFVEDTAIVTEETAIIACPGAVSRRGEEHSMEPVLAHYRKIERILPPATLEGGDVLAIEDQVFIGVSERTNQEGIRQIRNILKTEGKTCTPILLPQGLHLKSSVNFVGQNTLLITQDLADLPAFKHYRKIILDKGEEYAANTLLVNDALITPKGFPSTRKKLQNLDLPIIELDISEVRKMDGGLTCMSLRF